MANSTSACAVSLALWIIGGCVVAAAAGTGQGSEPDHSPAAVRPASPRQVLFEDHFWAPKLRTIIEKSIPHSWHYVDGELRALRKAAGEAIDGELNGTWGEANLYKLLETIAYALALAPDAALEHRADEIIDLVGRAQRDDGYVHAYVINSGKTPWDAAFLDGSHDGYVLGHMIEAAVAYYETTGKRAFLDIARKAADQAHRHFLGPDGAPGFDGHAELELALVALYRVVPDECYLDLARAFIEWRGRRVVAPFSDTPRAYFQDHVPLRDQSTLEGHAVRAIFFASGVADVALTTGDVDYRRAAERFWASTAGRRMTLTGSIGPRQEHEAIGADYELPLRGYYESCAACGLVDFAHRLFLLERRGEPLDVLEQGLYNAVLHGVALDGESSYYQNPLSDRDNPRYNSWVCCPPNLSRTILKVGRYAYAFQNQDVYVNLYAAGSCTAARPDGSELVLHQRTDFPWNGAVRIDVDPPADERFTVHLRVPGWARGVALSVGGEPVAPERLHAEDGFVHLDRTWRRGDRIGLTFDLPVDRIEAHPLIKDCVGKIALRRGPLVYAFEGLDNDGDSNVELAENPSFQVEFVPDLLGGVSAIRSRRADGRPVVAVPFYALANREKSSQEVWIAQRGLAPSDDDRRPGRLYRPITPSNQHLSSGTHP